MFTVFPIIENVMLEGDNVNFSLAYMQSLPAAYSDHLYFPKTLLKERASIFIYSFKLNEEGVGLKVLHECFTVICKRPPFHVFKTKIPACIFFSFEKS